LIEEAVDRTLGGELSLEEIMDLSQGSPENEWTKIFEAFFHLWCYWHRLVGGYRRFGTAYR